MKKAARLVKSANKFTGVKLLIGGVVDFGGRNTRIIIQRQSKDHMLALSPEMYGFFNYSSTLNLWNSISKIK
jgi:hypothetical protein